MNADCDSGLSPHTSPGLRSHLAVAAVFVLAAVVSTVLVWRSEIDRLQIDRARVSDISGDHAHALQANIERALSATYSLAALVRQGRGHIPDFDATASEMLPYFPGVSSLQLAPGGVVRRIVPLAGNEGAIGHDLLKDPARNKEAFLARDTGKLTLAGPFKLVQGGIGAVGRLPVFLDNDQGRASFWGFTVVLIRFPEVLNPARLSGLVERGYQYELWRTHPDTGERQVIASSSPLPLLKPVEHQLELPNGTWTLSVAPTNGWGDAVGLALKAALSLLFSLLASGLAHAVINTHLNARRMAEELTADLKESESKYRQVINTANEGIWMLGPEMMTTFVNAQLAEWIGYCAAEMLNRPVTDFMFGEDVPDHLKKIADRRLGLSDHYERRFRRKDGETVWALVSTVPVLDDKGRTQGVFAMLTDISKRKQAEEELLRLTEFQRAILNSAAYSIISTTPDGFVTGFNPAAERLLGYAAVDVIGKQTPALWHDPEEIARYAGQLSQELGETVLPGFDVFSARPLRKLSEEREWTFICKDGRRIPVNLSVTALRDEGGQITGFLGMIYDLAERKQAEIERLTSLHFFESMDRVNRAIQGAKDLEQMMRDVLDVVLASFDCDRAFLLYPCDPDADSWSVPMERCKPEYPGVLALGIDVPLSNDVAQTFRTLLAADGPVKFGPGTQHPLPADAAERFGFKSIISMAFHPNVGSPWQFGLHQCSRVRNWTVEEEKLFREIARRLADVLSILLSHRDLQKSEARYRRIVDTATEGIWGFGPDTATNFVNARMATMLGYSSKEMTGRLMTDFMFVEDLPDYRQRLEGRRGGAQETYERRFRRKDGQTVWTLVSATPVVDDQHRFQGAFGMFTDITERKRVEDALLFVAQRGWQASAENFFDALAQFLGEELDMDYVLIDRIDENPEMAETVALYAKGAITPNMRYALKGTPCENVMGRRLCVYPHGIQQLFPEDTLLTGMGAESYVGIPLWDSTGQPIGLIAVMGNKPLPDDSPVTQLLQLVATRAAAELERERSNRLLRSREHEFRTLAANLPDNVVRYDLEGRTVYVNPVLEETLGADAARMLGRRIREYLPAGSYEAFAQAVDAALASGENGEIEFTVPFPGREPIVHQIRMIVERDEQGEVSGLLAIGRDITELKRAEQALQERERHSQSLLHLSRNLEHAQTYAEVLHAAQGEVANIMGYQNLWVYLLSEDKAHLKALVASGPESGVVMSEEGTATLTIAGDKMLEEIAQAKEIVVVEDARTDPRVNQEIVARLAMRTIVNVPIILSGRHLGCVGVGTFGAEGVRIPSASEQRYLGALASHLAAALDRIQLLAERKKAAEELLRYKDHLEEQVQHRTADLVLARNAAEAASRAKSVFLSSMSHELRTPLNAILGFSNMMRKDALLQSEQRQHLDIINRSGEHLLNLINDVLEMAKIEAGRVQVEKVPFDLGSLVRDVTDMMHVRAREKGLQLRIDQSSEFPRYIRGDQGRLRQVLINLLGNAVKFTRQGAVTVRFGLKPLAKPQRLLIEVQDSGIGISADDQKRVFEPFVQFGETAAQQGTGLGLSISRQFVQLMGGTICFESTLGQGSTFRLELPMERVAAADVLKPQGADGGEIVGLAPDQPIYRILIVEDQLDNQLLLTKLMKNVGFEVKLATDGAQALGLFQSWRPHLIWMDRRMPVMDGLEATRRIRALAAGAEVKIVAVTASVFTEQRDEMLRAGMDDFVRKPYRFNEIYDCMTRQLGVRYKYAQARVEEEVSDVVLTSEMLLLLSPDRRRELRAALENLDGERIGAVLAQIASLDSKLHKTLYQLIENFDYPAILKALQTNQPAKPT